MVSQLSSLPTSLSTTQFNEGDNSPQWAWRPKSHDSMRDEVAKVGLVGRGSPTPVDVLEPACVETSATFEETDTEDNGSMKRY
jgi:hypothetical protein